MSEGAGNNVAIACQGGGSHTAFTAGVLRTVLPALEASDDTLVGLSGTSGGAVSAVAGWYGLLAPDTTAPEVLDAVWADIAASDCYDLAVNDAVVWGSTVENMGFPTPMVSPYDHPLEGWGKRRLRTAITDNVDFDAVPGLASVDAPSLVVGTVDVTAGEFTVFRDGGVTPKAVLASAAVPDIFEAVEIDGDRHWDGLFSQNPPIRELFQAPYERKPDELWVVQVNPQSRAAQPTSLRDIVDRRNELAGNISLNQELHFVERFNALLEEGHLPEDRYRHTEIRRLQLDGDHHQASKLDRSPAFLADLREQGERQAESLLEDR
jgi:NTE family protein